MELDQNTKQYIDNLIRDLAKQLAPERNGYTRLMQGQVQSIQVDTVTITANGGTEPVAGWRYLLDGYAPVVGDVVYILDGGPGRRFILGTVNR